MKKIVLQISEEEFAFAERMAKEDGYFRPEDCLNGILNTALMHWMHPAPDNHTNDPLAEVLRLQDAKISVLRDMLFESLKENIKREGTWCGLTEEEMKALPSDGPADLDDGIPF